MGGYFRSRLRVGQCSWCQGALLPQASPRASSRSHPLIWRTYFILLPRMTKGLIGDSARRCRVGMAQWWVQVFRVSTILSSPLLRRRGQLTVVVADRVASHIAKSKFRPPGWLAVHRHTTQVSEDPSAGSDIRISLTNPAMESVFVFLKI